MEYQVNVKNEFLWVELPKELDHYSADLLRAIVKGKIKENYVKYVIFDFHQTDMMDSSGIGLITGRYREMAAKGGQVYVSNVSNHMKKVLTLSGLYRIVIPWEQVVTETSELNDVKIDER